MLKNNWIVFNDKRSLSESLAKDVLKIAKQSIDSRGYFSIVLAGGSSPIELYKILKESSSDWGNWHVYVGDERCLPKNDKERNDYIIEQVWLNSSSIFKDNIFFIKAELGMIEARRTYDDILECIEIFDVVLLSMGEDGHTASLFPDHKHIENNDIVLEYNSPKPPDKRISMSYSRLNNTRNVFKIISGKYKQNAVKLWLDDKDLPINKINGDNEVVYICRDALSKKILS